MTDQIDSLIPLDHQEELPDKNLQCVRVEINSHVTIFLYYKIYPKSDSKKFPQERSAIFFYFDSKNVDDKFFWTYISLVGQLEEVELGSYINKKGSKKKRRVVSFAIVKFLEEESLTNLLNRYETQMKINNFLEMRRNRRVNLDYDTMKDIEEDLNGEEMDEEGFVTVTKDAAKKRFSKNGLSFKVSKKNNEEEEEKIENKKNKKDFFWNFQFLDKKRQMYDELKNLFDDDKKAIENKKNKLS